MSKTLFLLALSFSLSTLGGCAAATSPDGEEPMQDEEELKAAECPTSVEVKIAKPSIASDAQLTSSWARDMADYENDPHAAAVEQLTQLSAHVAMARSETKVTLRGTRGARCFYATVDASTGKANGYSFWFAKTGGKNGQLQLRVTRTVGAANDTLFFNAPLTTLSPSALVVDTAKDARVYAQHTESGYHGEPEGPNAWIGSAKITAKLH